MGSWYCLFVSARASLSDLHSMSADGRMAVRMLRNVP